MSGGSDSKREEKTAWERAAPYVVGALGGFAAAWVLKKLRSDSEGKRIEARTPKGSRRAPRRCAGMVTMKEGMYAQYVTLHDAVWEEVMARMYTANMRNFVVYLHEPSHTMFHHFEYIGDDFDGDMAAVEADPVIRKWWSFCEPCQEPAQWEGPPPSAGGDGGPNSAWWAPLKCLNSCGAWPTAWSTEMPDPDFAPNRPDPALVSTFAKPAGLVHNRTPEVTAGLAKELAGREHEF